MGFLKGFPKYLVGDVSAGTGLSGILAAGTLFIADLIMKNEQSKKVYDNKWILFLLEIPTVYVYYKAFSWLVFQKETFAFDKDLEDLPHPNVQV